MTSRSILFACVCCVSLVSALPYDGDGAANYARKWQNWSRYGHDGFTNWFASGGNCCKFMSRAMSSDSGGKIKFWGVKETMRKVGQCSTLHTVEFDSNYYKVHPRPGKLDAEGHFMSIAELKVCLGDYGLLVDTYSLADLRLGIPPGTKRGDLIFVDPNPKNGNDRHVMIVDSLDTQHGRIYYTDHHGAKWVDDSGKMHDTRGFSCKQELVNYIDNHNLNNGTDPDWPGCRMVHMPTSIKGCRDIKQIETWDSTLNDRGVRIQVYRCCWKERLGGEWPWTDNPTPYASLYWERHSGQSYDTLIVPRMNLAGCSAAVVQWASLSNLRHRHYRGFAKVLGSTDDGASWDSLGNDSTSEVSLPPEYWNNRNVRLAFAFHGDVDSCISYWCIDFIRLLAKPTRDKDVCVSEIHEPFSMAGRIPSLGPGQTIKPTAFVWNSGRQDESLPFTFRIDYGDTCLYTDTRWMNLCPYFDTCVQFSPWVVPQIPGRLTALCYSDLPGDECPANDTVTMDFEVASDTWIKMRDVFGSRGMSKGACLGAFNNDSIYMGVRKKLFAKYGVSSNIWGERGGDAPRNFGNGAALAYPGSGDYIYAIFGASKLFCRYSVSGKCWSNRLCNTPKRIDKGGDLAWGGNYLYALQGSNKRKFFRCDTAFGSSWQYMDSTPRKINEGGSLVWDDGIYLYALEGSGARGFFRYNIVSNNWGTLPSVPTPVGDGGALACDTVADVIYAFTGKKTCEFWLYNPQLMLWMPGGKQAPRPIMKGGCLAHCNHSVYAGIGQNGRYNTDNFWRYLPPAGGGGELLSFEAGQAGQTDLPLATPSIMPGFSLDPGELLTFDPTDKHTPRYSSNGWIAYTAEDSASEGTGLYRIPAVGGPAEALGPDSMMFEDPVWSGDGTWLVAAAYDGIYRLMSGTAPFRLAEGVVGLPQITANDSWIMYEKWDTVGCSHDVYKVRPNGTWETCLTLGPAGYVEPQPISDSEFACVQFRDEVHQVRKVAPGQEVWLTSDYMENSGLRISPDRQWLTYEKVDESGFCQIYKMRIDGTEESRVTDGTCNCETPVFSPNGLYIAYTKWPIDTTSLSDFSQVCYIGVGIGSIEVALNEPDAERENPCWSPDCQYIIYEKTVESNLPILGKKEKHKQIGRARTRIRGFDGVQALDDIPKAFALYQNRPNPFGRTTTVRYALPVPSLTELNIYDVSGRTVARLVQSEQKPGYYSVVWKGTDMRGRSVPAGTYFYVLKSNGKIAQKRMLLVR